MFDGDFAKMREKIYMFKENIFIINGKDQGILATSNRVPFKLVVLMRTTEETATLPSHLTKSGKTPKLLVRESTGSSKVSSRGLIPFSNTYHRMICTICL